MLLRRTAPLAIALAALACAPTVPFDTANNPTTIDYAVFDPTGNPPDVPLPNDLALTPQAIASQPPAQAALLTQFALDTCAGSQGCFPNDQEVPITVDFVTQTIDPTTGATTRSAPKIDTTSINASNLLVLSLSASASGAVAYDAPQPTDYVTNGDHGTLTLHKSADPKNGGSRRWPANTRIVVAVRGGANGVKVTSGATGGLQPQPTFYLLLQDKDLTLPENEQLIRLGLPPGTTRAQADAAAVQLETIRKKYLALFGAIDASGAFKHGEMATMGTFAVADTAKRTHVETDPSAGRIPLPSDFLTGADGHLLPALAAASGPFGPLGVGLATLDGFSTTAMILSQTSTAIQASTVQGGVFLYKLTPAAPTPIRRLLEVTEAVLGGKTPGYAAEPSPITQAAVSGGSCAAHPSEPCLSTAIGLQPAVPAQLPSGSVLAIPPLDEGCSSAAASPCTYVVVVTDKVKDLNGDPLVRSTLGKILMLDPSISVASGGKSTVAGVTDAQAVGIDQMRQAINAAAAALAAEKSVTRDHIVMAYTFHTLGTGSNSMKGTATNLAALPYSNPTALLTPPTGTTPTFYCAGTALANTAVCPGTTGTLVTDGFNAYGVDPAVAPNGNIGYIIDTKLTTFNKLLCNAGDTTCLDTGAFQSCAPGAPPTCSPATINPVLEPIPVLIALPQPGTSSFASGCVPGPPGSGGNSPNGVCTLPLIVFHHGLNGGRADVLNLADRFTKAGFAVAAIDANKHGDRAFCDPGNTTTPQCVGGASACVANTAQAGEGDATADVPGHCTGDYVRRPKPTGCTTCTNAKAIPLASGNYLISGNLFRSRDTLRQDIIDQSQLARVLSPNPGCDKTKPPTDPATCANKIITATTGVQIDPAKIYFVGQSLGAISGTVDVAANPRFSRATLNVGGSTVIDTFTDQSSNLSSALNTLLTALGISLGTPAYLQFINVAKWVIDPADPENFAQNLTANTLPSPLLGGAAPPAKKILGQMALCDSTVTNTWNANLYSLVGLGPVDATHSTLTTFVAHGLPTPSCPANLVKHGFLLDWTDYPNGASTNITQAAQDDITNFFADTSVLPPPAESTP